MAGKTELTGLLPLPDRAVSSGRWRAIFGSICLLSAVTRLYDLRSPPWVAWDETHFGKMANWYINRTFFFDVHPPLGKILIAGAGYATGYNGSFPFTKPGEQFNETSFVGMRALCATMGASIVPMAFITVDDLTGSVTAATLGSLLLALDVGITTISRFILLDPILMFFMAATTMFNFKFNKYRSFSGRWWLTLSLTGLSLGCVLSVKFVGVFVLAVVGLYTVTDLWSIFCDYTQPLTHTVKHFLARALCLIAIPAATYLMVYCIHDALILQVGDQHGFQGDSWLSAGSQMQLKNSDMYKLKQPQYLAYGSLVTLQTIGSHSSFLHSHNLSYPAWDFENTTDTASTLNMSEIYSVTGFRLKDVNNFWKIVPHDEEDIPDWENPYLPPEPVLNGDTIRLIHNGTGRTLSAFTERAVKTSTQQLVGTLPQKKTKEFQTAFVLNAAGLPDEAQIEAINTTFRLYNPYLKCALYVCEEKLPDWAAQQLEVTCSKRLTDDGVFWSAHRNIHPGMPNVTKYWRRFHSTLLQRFVETHRIITTVNGKLKPNRVAMLHADKPWMWPILYRGQYFSMVDSQRVYLLGTAPIWWANLALLLLSGLIMMYIGYRAARGEHGPDAQTPERQRDAAWRRRTGLACLWLVFAWAVHYAPFWTMGRILYFHHYFPALCYSCMLSGVVLDFLLTSLYRKLPAMVRAGVYHWLVAAIVAGLFYSFYLFAPLCYGMTGPRPREDANSTYHAIWWLGSWDI
ncbi:protein O-mannosyl-transferase 2-like [Amphibalanus amphitrite]|uniref:protein O-mannosyl-transferase 2-like n=1 Tax=Amphibalanus amphitrite TaxID=1232801 RepID=UPI001C9178FF|nr:protein O-mannosyl-transferase 2-like [Amphibalanus amphitrite]XP_043203520.1 protein O-mannosyl-transferase 2-like [Amphibalanus amphitrite]